MPETGSGSRNPRTLCHAADFSDKAAVLLDLSGNTLNYETKKWVFKLFLSDYSKSSQSASFL
jgi:hypothetical protein